MQFKLFVDVRENKSKPTLTEMDEFAQMMQLKTGDAIMITEEKLKYFLEIKIGKDAHDYARMRDEFYRMSQVQDMEAHAVYIHEPRPFTEDDMKDLRIMISLAQEYQIYFHDLVGIESLPSLLRKIADGKYARGSSPYFKKPPSTIPMLARRLALFKGMTEAKAIHIAEKFENDPHNYHFCLLNNPEIFYDLMGRKKNGEPTKLATEIVIYETKGETGLMGVKS